MKKKVLFAYNGRIEVDKNGNFYGNELNDKLVERYLTFGDMVSFLVRLKPIQEFEYEGLMPFVNESLEVVGLPDFSSPKLYLANIGKVKQIIREQVNNSDVIISRLPSLVGREAIKHAINLNKPYLVEVVGCPWDALFNHSLIGKVYAPFAYYMLRRQVKNAPFVLYVTTKFLQNRYPSHGNTVGVTDVVLDSIEDSVFQNRIRKIKNMGQDKPVIIGTAAGYDVKFKGQELVIEAISELKKQNKIFHYHPVGKGLGNRLRNAAKQLGVLGQLKLIGQLKHNKIFDYLDSIDVYIQPSKQEGLPRSVIEAMSRACPVIGSSAGGIPELLDTPYIFKKGNVGELTKILDQLSTEQLVNQATRNYKFAQKFETKKMDEKRLDFYNMFIASYLNE